MAAKKIAELLGDKAEYLLNHQSKTISKDQLHLPGPDFVDRIWASSDRNPQVLRNLQQLYGNGRLANTGYLSILPVDQGIEHSGGASFAKNPIYFDPENIIKLAIEGGCNAVATTYGGLGFMARKYAHKIRPDNVCLYQTKLESGSCCCRRHYLFRQR
jgi:fructose-bisphosphate aldolase, class I